MTQTTEKLQGIPAPTRNGKKIEGEFYPLQKEELIALKRSRLINNAAFVHFALRYENPFCAPRSGSLRDRPPASVQYIGTKQQRKVVGCSGNA